MSRTRAPEVVLPAGLSGAVRQRTIDTGEVALAAVEIGPETAPAVVVAHGVGSSARFVIEAFAAPVIAAGGRLVAYDLRGHGASDPVRDPGRHRLDDHVGDLAALVASLPDPPTILGGVSLGGHAVVRAADRGVAASALLACLPAWSGPATAGDGPHAAVAAEVRRDGLERVIARLRRDTSMPAWLRETVVNDYSRHDPASLTAALVALDGGDAPTAVELRALGDLPLAVVGWPDDPGHPLAEARRWAELAPNAELGQLHLEDLAADRSRLGATALATLSRLAPELLPAAHDLSPRPAASP